MTLADSLREKRDAVVNGAGKGLLVVAQEFIETVRARTRSGRDVNGRTFISYSVGYAKRKKGGRVQPVTLTDTGEMLNDLIAKKEGRNRVVVKFATRESQQKARYLQESRRKPRRFFGVSLRQSRKLRDMLNTEIHQSLPKADRRTKYKLTFFQ